MIWAAFSRERYSEVAFLTGRQNLEAYMGTLKDYLLPLALRNIKRTTSFQQDNASCYASNAVKQWFQDNNIDIMSWPAKSPVLNPIQNLWGIGFCLVFANGLQVDTIEELKACKKPVWLKLTLETREGLVHRMLRPCAAVLEAGRENTKYWVVRRGK